MNKTMSKTILIVEDEVEIANLIKERLNHHGYNASVSYTVTEAVARIKESRPDAITLDIKLPDGSGLDVLKRLIVTESSTGVKNIPVIVVSAYDNERPASEELGAKRFLNKPINFNKLLQVIDEVLQAEECLQPCRN